MHLLPLPSTDSDTHTDAEYKSHTSYEDLLIGIILKVAIIITIIYNISLWIIYTLIYLLNLIYFYFNIMNQMTVMWKRPLIVVNPQKCITGFCTSPLSFIASFSPMFWLSCHTTFLFWLSLKKDHCAIPNSLISPIVRGYLVNKVKH